MKLKAVALALLLAGFSTSVAVAGDGHGKGKGKQKSDDAKALVASSTTSTTTTAKSGKAEKAEKAAACRPSVQLEIRGTVAATSAGSLAVLVTKGGPQGAKLAGKQLTFDVSKAKVRGTLASGAPVRVHARACVDLVALTVQLQATQVRVGTVKDDGDDDGTTSTTTTTESTTTTP